MPKAKRSPEKQPKPARAAHAPVRTDCAVLALLSLLGVAVYWNSFASPFVFDGEILLRNFTRGEIWPWQLTVGRNRPVGFFTFGANYALGGVGVWGYHAVPARS